MQASELFFQNIPSINRTYDGLYRHTSATTHYHPHNYPLPPLPSTNTKHTTRAKYINTTGIK